MRTVLRRALGAATAGALAAGGLLITAAPASAFTASPCMQACIVADDVSGTPEGAVFAFHTTGLTRAQVRVTNLNGSNPVVLTPDTTWGSNYELTADDNNRFHQGNVYKYAIYATDTSGITQSYSGEFVTLYRTTSIHYDNLHIVKDGDTFGPGDFVGDGRCNETGTWAPLKPLIDDSLMAEFDSSLYAELNDGDTKSLNVSYDCPTPGPRTIEAETALEDDDDVSFNPDFFPWAASSPYGPGQWDVPQWDEAYTTQMITDPLDPTATGSADVPIATTSPYKDPIGEVANVRYQVTGKATFTHTAPMVSLPKPVIGWESVGTKVSPGTSADQAWVTWNAKALPELPGAVGFRVQWLGPGEQNWHVEDIPDVGASSFTLTGLTPGMTYYVAVGQLMPGNLVQALTPLAYLAPTPTLVNGWSTTTVTAPVGTTVPVHLTVSDGGTPRTVQLEYKLAGSTSWGLASSAQTDGSGHVSFTMGVGAGYTQWRVSVPATNAFEAETTAGRLLVAKTAITGFNAATVTAPAGTKVNDGVVVMPAANRTANLLYRKAGATAWVLKAKLTTDATGAVVLPEVAQKGAYQWQLVVPAAPAQGTAAWSSIRTINGT